MTPVERVRKVAERIFKENGILLTGVSEVEDEEGKVIVISGRIPYFPEYSELERKVWDEIEKETGIEILVSIIPVHKSEEERLKAIEELSKEFKALVS